MSSLLMLSNADSNYSDVISITAPNRMRYAAKNGHALEIQSRTGTSSKIECILSCFDRAEWIWWLDADAVITNMELDVLDLIQRDMVITTDFHGLNAGSILIRTTELTRRFFQATIDRQGEYNWNNCWGEQNAIAYLLWTIHDNVAVLPNRAMNSYPPESAWQDSSQLWQPGDFVLHCPGVPHARRLQILKEHSGN